MSIHVKSRRGCSSLSDEGAIGRIFEAYSLIRFAHSIPLNAHDQRHDDRLPANACSISFENVFVGDM